MKNDLVLKGCSPIPLAHYLKGLGILRLVAEQRDPDAEAFWGPERFLLRSALDEGALVDFFLHDYRPTPIIAPWNGGSGFYPKDNKMGIDAIGPGKSGRLQTYAQVISVAQSMIAASGLQESPKDEQKFALLSALRGALPDEALEWMDAALLLSDGEAKYPPLLGTGGNDGRLDFTNNFMQRLVLLFNCETGAPTPDSKAWLRSALYGETCKGLHDGAIGQFSPGAAGGPNATSGFDGSSLTNPWDFVLMLEGALPFAAAATRRMESTSSATLSYPFTVRSSGAGSGAVALADEGQARAEMWLPLWSRLACFDEVQALLSEGRATLGRRPAKDGLDFVRAVTALGVDRGIEAFQRYAFVMRSGKAYLATPLNRVQVKANPQGELINELEQSDWLGRFRRFARDDKPPARLKSLARLLDDVLFELVQHGKDGAVARHVQEVLVVLGRIQAYLGTSPGARKVLPPVPQLRTRWVMAADDASDEFRIAAALAGLDAPGMPMRAHFAPVTTNGWAWDEESRLAVWGPGRLVENLLAVQARRLLEAERASMAEKPFGGSPPADLAAISAFLAGTVDDARISALTAGLALADSPRQLPPRKAIREVLPAAYALLRLLFTPESMLRAQGILPPDRLLSLPPGLLPRLRAGRVAEAVTLAHRRLRASGVEIVSHPPDCVAEGARLAAALLVPVEDIRSLYLRIRPATSITNKEIHDDVQA